MGQIVVIDAESTDGTQELARHYTPLVIVRQWEGYGPQKNFGILQATGDWILILDADERVSPELAQDIQEQVTSWTSDFFKKEKRPTMMLRFMRT